MKKIKYIKSESILDSRGTPTLSVTVATEGDDKGNFQVPSGASTGAFEAYELRDTDLRGVNLPCERITEIITPALIGVDVADQDLIDKTLIELDGTVNRKFLGGNSMIGVSVASLKASANALKIDLPERISQVSSIKRERLPYLYFNLINGGKHTKTKLPFQEYHVVPIVEDISLSLNIAKTIQESLKKAILPKYPETEIGDEGGFALDTTDIFYPLDILNEVVLKLGLKDKVRFALDVAASSFFDQKTNKYLVAQNTYTTNELFDIYRKIIEKYNIISIEDPFHEEDFESFAKLQKEFPEVIIVGDDLTVTNINRLNKAVSLGSIKGIIIKPNQVGTMTETFETMRFAIKNNIKCIVSHRSGETMDDFIADLAYATGAFGIKSGAPGPKEREVKYRRLEYLAKINK